MCQKDQKERGHRIPLHCEKQLWIFCLVLLFFARYWYGKNSSSSILGNPDLINEEEDDHNDDDNHFVIFGLTIGAQVLLLSLCSVITFEVLSNPLALLGTSLGMMQERKGK